MRAHILGIILLGVALSLGSDLVVHPQAPAAGALAPSHGSASRVRHAPATRVRVKVTAYSRQRPTASGRRVRPGMVALSRDVERALGVAFGDRVVVEGLGTFVFDDRVSRRHRRHADIFLASSQAARRFGVKATYVRVRSASS